MSTDIVIDYVLDTNIVIFTLEGSLRAPLDVGAVFGLSAISKLELLGAPNLSAQAEKSRAAFIERVVLVSIGDEVIEEAIHLRRHRGLRTPDAIIAATALHYNAILLTNDGDLLRALGPMAQGVAIAPRP